MPRKTTSLVVAVAAFAAAAPAAHASDATLRQAIKQQDAKTKPDERAFAKAVASFAKTHRASALRSATQRLTTDVKAAHSAIAAQQASTAKVRKGRVLYLTALTKLGRGLKSFDTALADLQKGHNTKAKAALARAAKQISSAEGTGNRAEKLIGVKG